MAVGDALANHTPTRGDVIKSKTKTSTYSTKWSGTFTLEPGQGYIYISKANAPSFVYSNSTRGNAPETIEEITYWTAERARFANNMTVIAALELDGTIQSSSDIEVGAFVNGECRDAVKLTYIDDLDQYFAILTVSGNNGETVNFKAYENGNVINLDETVTVHIDDIIGDVDHPFVLHTAGDAMTLFPNPAAKGETVRMELPANVDFNGATVEIYNALGALVRTETLANNRGELTGLQTPGIYTVKVTDQKGNTHINKLIVR